MKTFSNSYIDSIIEKTVNIINSNNFLFDKVSSVISSAIIDNAILHTFGCGHSAFVASDVCYRAGSFALINFLGLLPGKGGLIAATDAENEDWRAEEIIKKGCVSSKDIVIVVSNSGSSKLIQSIIKHIKYKNARIICITGCNDNPLAQNSDFCIVTNIPQEDCALNSKQIKYGPLSSIISNLILNMIITSTIEKLIKRNFDPFIFKSVHLPNGKTDNQVIIDKFKDRIPSWQHSNIVDGDNNEK